MTANKLLTQKTPEQSSGVEWFSLNDGNLTGPEELLVRIQAKPGSYENLGRLIEIDPKRLSPSGKIDYLAALEKQYSWLYSLIQEATLAIAGNEPSMAENIWEGVDESEREDVATALRLSPNTAQTRIDVARTLSKFLPGTCSALANGEISSSHATLIARETAEAIERGVDPVVISEVESKALAHAEFHTAAQVGRKLKALFAKYAPEKFEERVQIARDTRRVSIYPEGDGMSTLLALLPSEDAQLVYLALNEMVAMETEAKSNFSYSDDSNENADSQSLSAKDVRSMDMKRADALATLAIDFLNRVSGNTNSEMQRGDIEDKNGQRLDREGRFKGLLDIGITKRKPVYLNLTMDLPTLLGLKENPAELVGFGPIPASIARKLAADAKWRKFITDPLTGNLLDMGRDSYLPSQALVDFLSARDRTCRFPGCSQSVRIGDVDHAIPWDEGGQTNPGNLGFLCRRHHRLKTQGGWRLESDSDGSCTWISPRGKRYFVPPRPMQEIG
jgi:hypothetical protein